MRHKSVFDGLGLAFLLNVLSTTVLLPNESFAQSGHQPDRMIERTDTGGDGRISRSEWRRLPPAFDGIGDGDGYATAEELGIFVRNRFSGRSEPGMKSRVGGGRFGMGGGSPLRDPVDFYFPGYDANSDGHLDRKEWKRRGNFERLDADKNGAIEPSEFRALYEDWGRKGAITNPIRPADPPVMDTSLEVNRISSEELGTAELCPFVRFGILGRFRCQDGDRQAEEAGLIETGIGPVFPTGAFCHGIDEIYALDYVDKTGAGRHGGIDLPTDFGTPILAAATGTVVGKFDPERHARGKTVVLRHSPEDTGLPFWVYTEYGHLDELPAQEIGQRVRMGEILAPTGNSGISKKNRSGVTHRRPGIHFAVYYSDSPQFAVVPNYVAPKDGRWMDPNALYRTQPPYDSQSLQALPDAGKVVPVPVMFLDGTFEPAGTKLIWPYACQRE